MVGSGTCCPTATTGRRGTWGGGSGQTRRSFQRPRRKIAALTTATVENAIITASATPRGPSASWRASPYARGTYHSQKHPRLIQVGVHVSPAPLNDCVITIP